MDKYLVGRYRDTKVRNLEFLEYLYAWKDEYKKKSIWYLYSHHLERILNRPECIIRRMIRKSVELGFFDIDKRQKDGQGGVRISYGAGKFPSNTYKNFNDILILENIQYLRGLLGLPHLEYDEEVCKEIRAKSFTHKEFTPTELEENLYNEYKDEITEYNNRVADSGKIKFIEDKKGRGINLLCTTKNPDKHPEDMVRDEILKQDLGDKYFHFDINGSMYRISYNLSHDTFFPWDKDIYEYLFNYIFPNEGTFVRDDFKSVLMPIYMKGQSIFIKNKHIKRVKNQINIGIPVLDNKDLALYDYYTKLDNLNLSGTYYESLQKMWISLKNLYGEAHRKRHIFIDETFIMIMTANLIYKKYGRNSMYLYDCLYIEGDAIPEEELYKLYHEATLRYKDSFYKHDKEIKDRINRKRKLAKKVDRIQKNIKNSVDNVRQKIYNLIRKGFSSRQIITKLEGSLT